MPKRILSLFRNLFRKRAIEQALDDELRSTLEVLTQEKIEQGLSQAVARREALIEIGGIEQVKERVRAVRAGHFVEDLVRGHPLWPASVAPQSELHCRRRSDAGTWHRGDDSHFQRGERHPHPTFALCAPGETRRSRARPSWHQPVQLASFSGGILYLPRAEPEFRGHRSLLHGVRRQSLFGQCHRGRAP